jgi:hypothetical protein
LYTSTKIKIYRTTVLYGSEMQSTTITQAKAIPAQGAEEDIWASDAGSNRRLEKTAQ